LVSRYLHACDVFADWDVHIGYDQKGFAEWMETLRVLTVSAPDFATSQYLYGLNLAMVSRGAPADAAAGMRRQAQAYLDKAVAADPNSPMANGVRAMIIPVRDWGERERLLRRAVDAAPGFPVTNFWLGAELA